MADTTNTDPDGPAMQRLLDVRCHLRYIANDLHTSDRTAMHMQEVARECLEKTHSMRVLEREHEARIRADERARIAKELHRMAVAETESDARSAGLHEAAMFVESNGESAAPPASESLYRSNCPKKGHCVQGCLRTEPCRAEQTPTYDEVMALAAQIRRRNAAEPAAPDPWALPEPLTWGHDRDGWYIVDGEYWLRLSYDNAGSVLRRRDDGDHLIDLIRRRNAT